jgi:hypothetical protein
MATTKITSPDLFDLSSLDSALQLPSGTTAQRPTSPSTGEWRYNTDNNLIEFYDGGAWRDLQDEAVPPIPSENFNTVLYTGNGSTQSITGVGFQPDFVWVKNRDSGTANHRSITYGGPVADGSSTSYLKSNTTDAQSSSANTLTSLNSNGFSVYGTGGETNASGNDYVAWCWKANGGQVNTKAGFSIVTYTGNGGTATLGHGLSAVPDFVITKMTQQNTGSSSTSQWMIWHKDLSGNSGTSAPYNLYFATDAQLNLSAFGTYNQFTATTFPVSRQSTSTAHNNNNNSDYVAYCFHSVAGYSSFGSYTGNGSATGPIITTGFELAFLMVKNITTGSTLWLMADNKRDTNAIKTNYLQAQSSDAEFSPYTWVEFLSDGFQLKNTGASLNANGANYIYIAFATDP